MTSFRKMHESMGLFRTWQQGHTIETIQHWMVVLREQYPKAGAREIISLLFHKYSAKVSRSENIVYGNDRI